MKNGRADPAAREMKNGRADPAARASVIIAVVVMMVVVVVPPVMMVMVMVMVLGEHPPVHAFAVRPRRQIPRRSRLGSREQHGRIGNWLQQFSETPGLKNFLGIGSGGRDLCRPNRRQNSRANHSSQSTFHDNASKILCY